MIEKPTPNEYKAYYGNYIGLVPDGNVLEILSNQNEVIANLLGEISEEKSIYRYAENKWSIREVVGHIIDTERIFAYRALRISRNDKAVLAGFEQDDYVPNSNHNNILIKNLAEEFSLVRKANIKLFETFTDEMWLRTGTASGSTVSVRAAVYVIAGHPIHHINVLKEKYL